MGAALTYVARGWKVIGLNDVTQGFCSCLDGVGCASAGKHPMARSWQLAFLETPEQVMAVWGAAPGANVGIVTGPASGLWVLDVDPDHGGDESLRTLIAAHGRLPDTHTVQTGSGGVHYYFSTVGLDFDLTNRRGSMPRGNGLDIRGRGGFVVAPPSVSGRGAYRDLTSWVGGVAVAPAWLLDILRPAPAGERVEYLGADVARDGHAYAAAAVRGALGELAGCPPGGRNEVAFAVACRLVELVRAPWARLDWAEIESAFMAAGAAANVDGRFLDGEVWSVWLKAQRHVKGAAELPPAEHLGSFMPWSELPAGSQSFGAAGQGSATDVTGGVTGGVTGPDEGRDRSTTSTDANVTAFEIAVQRAGWDLQVREEARRRLDLGKAVGVDWGAEILDEDQMRAIPRPVALVSGWLFRNTLARIIGASGSMKSFTVVDMAVCVANGLPWHGCAVVAGPVLWIVAEGSSDADVRLRACKERYGLERHGVRVIIRPVQVGGPEWDSFVGYLAGLADGARPAFIIFDTQARVTEGVNENLADEMGVVVGAAERLREATQACVLLVHHTGLGDGERGRGSGAIFNALTTEILVAKSGPNLTLTGKKQKTIPTGAKLILTAVTRKVVDVGEFGIIDTVETVVLVGAADADATSYGVESVAVASTRDVARERALQLVHVLRSNFAEGNGGTRAEIRALFLAAEGIRELAPAGQRQAWARSWGRLEEAGRIGRHPTAERFAFVELDDADDLADNPHTMSEFGWPVARKKAKTGKS